MPGLGTSLGRGGATNTQQDFQNSDCIWIQGSALMEAHPVGARWALKARERGAKIIHVDPHFSRTSAMADMHVQIRAGSDIAFVGGLIRHVIETESYFREYVVNYTNAATIINEDFKDTEDLEGLFSGFDPETGDYDRSTWMYEGGEVAASAGVREHSTQAFTDRTGAGMMTGAVKSDETLQDPRCVFQILKKHYARYTPEMVERICGVLAGGLPGGGRHADRQLRPRAHHDARLRARLDAALLRRADDPRRARSSSCCSATSAVPAAGSWPCAATRRSRAPPTSRRCTTCCPATCRCRGRARTT